MGLDMTRDYGTRQCPIDSIGSKLGWETDPIKNPDMRST